MIQGSAQRGTAVGVALVTLVVLTAVVIQMSAAAFTAETASAANNWETGHVSLTNSMTGGAQFSATGMVPGQVVERCVLVSYTGNTGSSNVDIRMYGASTVTQTNSLASDLIVTVSSVAGDHRGAAGSCAATYASQSIQPYAATPRTLQSFATTHNSWTAGLSPAWVQNGNATRTYRVRVELSGTSTKTSSSASYVFWWQARTVNPTP